jgi:hypothetical protein
MVRASNLTALCTHESLTEITEATVIIAIGGGRAGNQMFQLGGIESVLSSKKEKIVLVNFADLEEIFPSLSDYAIVMRMPRLLARWYPYLDAAFRQLARWRVLGSVLQVKPEGAKIQRQRGLFPLTFFWGGYCQDEALISTNTIQRLFTRDILDNSGESVSGAGEPLLDNTISCFVHVRRGDYVNHPSAEFAAVLPSQWFALQMNEIRSQSTNVRFFILSDDSEWTNHHFADFPDATILDLDARDSFAFMSTCDAGILSPSTFSWWAAYFASQNSRYPFIAPKFWTGWRMGRWHPHQEIQASFLTYAEVTSFSRE